MIGTVVRVMPDRRFGFIKGRNKVDYFFHKEDFNGHFDDLVTDIGAKQIIEVSFNIVDSPKGPRAGEVTRTDGGVGEINIPSS